MGSATVRLADGAKQTTCALMLGGFEEVLSRHECNGRLTTTDYTIPTYVSFLRLPKTNE